MRKTGKGKKVTGARRLKGVVKIPGRSQGQRCVEDRGTFVDTYDLHTACVFGFVHSF